jgi:hypothetical protein
MNESAIKLKEIIEGERFKEIPSSQSNNDDIMQLIMKTLHDQRLKWNPMAKVLQLGHFCVLVINH